MMSPKRLEEIKKKVAEVIGSYGVGEALVLGHMLKDLIAEIDELQRRLKEVGDMHSQMCRLAAERFEEINALRARLGEPSIPSHFEET